MIKNEIMLIYAMKSIPDGFPYIMNVFQHVCRVTIIAYSLIPSGRMLLCKLRALKSSGLIG